MSDTADKVIAILVEEIKRLNPGYSPGTYHTLSCLRRDLEKINLGESGDKLNDIMALVSSEIKRLNQGCSREIWRSLSAIKVKMDEVVLG